MQSGRQPPNAKRTQQVRDAQRKYRMRKELRIAELTAEVAGLTERIAELEGLNGAGGFAKQEGSPAQTTCFMCETERSKSAQYLDRIQWLELRLAEVETSTAQTFLISPVSAALSAQSCILPEAILAADSSHLSEVQPPLAYAPQIASTSLPACVPLSAASLFGGPPNVEFHKKALKLIPSLRECSWVDTLYDTFVAQSFLTDRKVIKAYAIKVLTAKFRLFDSCECPEDRWKAVELVELFKARNRHYVSYMYRISRDEAFRASIYLKYGSPNQQDLLPGAQEFTLAVKEVPSLSTGADALIDEFCRCFALQAKCTSPEEKAETWLQLVDLQDRLESRCTEEDRAKFVMKMETVRVQFKHLHDEMLHGADVCKDGAGVCNDEVHDTPGGGAKSAD